MNQQPDKLFREKLHVYQQPVNSGAWNRISENITRRNRRVLWLRIAASLLLLAASGVFIYPALQKNASEPVAHNKALPKIQENGDVKPDTANQPSTNTGETSADSYDAVARDIHPDPAAGQHHVRTQIIKKKKHSLPKAEYAQTQPAAEIPLPITVNQNIVANNEVMINKGSVDTVTRIEQQALKNGSTTKTKNIKIVFTAEEVNEKYLAKISDAEATPEAKETSSLKTLLGKAYDLKNNQDVLGDLRQRKNEILAMNFKNEKKQTEND